MVRICDADPRGLHLQTRIRHGTKLETIAQILAVGSRHFRTRRYRHRGLALFARFVNPTPNRKSTNTLEHARQSEALRLNPP